MANATGRSGDTRSSPVWPRLIGAFVAAVVILLATKGKWEPGNPILHTITFLVCAVTGDAFGLLVTRQPLFIVEDLLRTMLTFAALGVLSAAASILAARYIHSPVHPFIPAIGAYIAYQLIPASRREVG